jgi:allantoinase
VPDRVPELVITGRRVVTPMGTRPAAIAVRSGLIVGLTTPEDAPRAEHVIDAGTAVVMPGLIDTHVHCNEPGREDWEGFASATRAAAAGGITTIVDMPVHCVPATTSVVALRDKIALAQTQAFVDIGFWAGLVPGGGAQAPNLLEAGALGFKCFLVPSGSDDMPHLEEGDLRALLPMLRGLGAPLIVHAELPGPIEAAWARLAAEGADARIYANFLRAQPRSGENAAVELLVVLAEEHGTPIHIAHYASTDTLALLRRARAGGVPVTVEATPHHLYFAAEEIPDSATEFKTTPPIRTEADREALWEALGDGTIDTIASDHSPCPPALKGRAAGDFASAWGGIAGLQLLLPVTWTGARTRGFSPHHLVGWLCAAPARVAGLDRHKGAIAPGRDADIVIWEPDTDFIVDPEQLAHRHKFTPYAGFALFGTVQTTLLRGKIIFDAGEFVGEPQGRVLKRQLG